jgi:HSP20 family protein
VATRRDIERLQEELEELFEEVWQGRRFAPHGPGFRPHVDMFLTDDPHELTIVVELAGVDPKELRVVVADDVLVISGGRSRLAPAPPCHVSWHQLEIPHGHFDRRIRLPESADASRARADYTRGLLKIVLPLAPSTERERPVAIRVTIKR